MMASLECTLADAQRQLPRVVLQYGPPRTATTLQTYILQIAMRILEPNTTLVARYVMTGGLRKLASPSNTTNYVFKSHSLGFASINAWPEAWRQAISDAALFVTASSKQSSEDKARKIEAATGRKVWHVQYAADLARGPTIVYDYSRILGMDSLQTEALYANIRFWSILRQCCGEQMSSDWRSVLWGDGSSRSKGSSKDPACETYDIDAVQAAYESISVLPHFSVNIRDSPCGQCGKQQRVNCSRYNSWVAARKAKFNQVAPCDVCDIEWQRKRPGARRLASERLAASPQQGVTSLFEETPIATGGQRISTATVTGGTSAVYL